MTNYFVLQILPNSSEDPMIKMSFISRYFNFKLVILLKESDWE